jgi:hypothetical protein
VKSALLGTNSILFFVPPQNRGESSSLWFFLEASALFLLSLGAFQTIQRTAVAVRIEKSAQTCEYLL